MIEVNITVMDQSFDGTYDDGDMFNLNVKMKRMRYFVFQNKSIYNNQAYNQLKSHTSDSVEKITEKTKLILLMKFEYK